MFHVKHPARRPAVFVLGLLALVAAGCTGRIGSADGWAGPVVAGDLVLMQERPGKLVALRIQDGVSRVEWRFPDDDDDFDLKAIYATPIVDGDRVYVAAWSGDVVALELGPGAPLVRWAVELPDPVVGTPAFDGATLYVGTGGGEIVPIAVAGGAVGPPLARSEERFWSDPQLDGPVLYVAGLDRRVRALDLASGGERWLEKLGGAVAGDAALDGDLLLVGALDRTLYALDVDAGGSERWIFDGDGWFWARPLVVGETVYAGTAKGSVYAVDRRDGKQVWQFPSDSGQIRARPILVAGVLLVAGREGVLYGLDPQTGDMQWSRTLAEGTRLLADPLELESRVLYVDTRGNLIEVDPQSGATVTVFERS